MSTKTKNLSADMFTWFMWFNNGIFPVHLHWYEGPLTTFAQFRCVFFNSYVDLSSHLHRREPV